MRQHYQQQTAHRDPDICNGLLFIPDISGFTELVHSTDVLTGQQITYELLSAGSDEPHIDMSDSPPKSATKPQNNNFKTKRHEV